MVNSNICREIDFKEKILQDLAKTSNSLLSSLQKKGCITEKELRYFSIEFKKATNLGKLYLLPKIHKRLFGIPGQPVILNCGSPTEKVLEFLFHVLKPVMQQSRSYIKDSSDFIKNIKEMKDVPKVALMATADVVGLYPSILHGVGLEALRKTLDDRVNRKKWY